MREWGGGKFVTNGSEGMGGAILVV